MAPLDGSAALYDTPLVTKNMAALAAQILTKPLLPAAKASEFLDFVPPSAWFLDKAPNPGDVVEYSYDTQSYTVSVDGGVTKQHMKDMQLGMEALTLKSFQRLFLEVERRRAARSFARFSVPEDITVTQMLERTRDYLDDPARWLKGTSTDVIMMDGGEVRTTRACLAATMMMVQGGEGGPHEPHGGSPTWRAAIDYLRCLLKGTHVHHFNDAEETTHGDVIRFLDKAIELRKHYDAHRDAAMARSFAQAVVA